MPVMGQLTVGSSGSWVTLTHSSASQHNLLSDTLAGCRFVAGKDRKWRNGTERMDKREKREEGPSLLPGSILSVESMTRNVKSKSENVESKIVDSQEYH